MKLPPISSPCLLLIATLLAPVWTAQAFVLGTARDHEAMYGKVLQSQKSGMETIRTYSPGKGYMRNILTATFFDARGRGIFVTYQTVDKAKLTRLQIQHLLNINSPGGKNSFEAMQSTADFKAIWSRNNKEIFAFLDTGETTLIVGTDKSIERIQGKNKKPTRSASPGNDDSKRSTQTSRASSPDDSSLHNITLSQGLRIGIPSDWMIIRSETDFSSNLPYTLDLPKGSGVILRPDNTRNDAYLTLVSMKDTLLTTDLRKLSNQDRDKLDGLFEDDLRKFLSSKDGRLERMSPADNSPIGDYMAIIIDYRFTQEGQQWIGKRIYLTLDNEETLMLGFVYAQEKKARWEPLMDQMIRSLKTPPKSTR